MLLVAVACGVSLLLLVVVMLLGPTGRGTSVEPGPKQVQRDPGDVDLPPGVPSQKGQFEGQVGELEHGEAVFLQEGRRTVLKYARLAPEADGVLRVEKPRARIIFSSTRVLEVASDTGVLIAPDGQLLEGTFTGNVVTTFYETTPDVPLELANPSQIRMRLYLDDAVYDEQLGRLRSGGPVFLTSQSLDASGSGLTLTFNPLRQRLERMIIQQGERIRFNPKLPGSSKTMANAASTPTDTEGPQEAPQQPAPIQYYQANFLEAVEVDVAFGKSTMTGDRLSVSFAIQPGTPEVDSDPDEAAQTRAFRRSEQRTSRDAFIVPVSNPAGANQAQAMPPKAEEPDEKLRPWDERSLMQRSLDDVTIAWKGKLQVDPLEAQPQGFAGPSDALIGIAGSPMRIRTELSEHVEAAQGDYLLSSGRLRAQSSPQHGLMLDSPRLGVMTGRAMEVVLSEAKGWVDGPGLLRAVTQNRGEPDAVYDLTAKWRGRLNLEFLTEAIDAKPAAGDEALDWIQPTQLTGIRMAQFNHDVDVDHPQFKAKAQKLELVLEPVQNGDPRLKQIDASGDVQLASLSDNPEQQVSIASQTLHLRMADPVDANDEAIRPQVLLARGDVEAKRPGYHLKASELFTRFSPTGDANDFELTRLLASDGVVVTATDQKATLEGDRLSANTAERRIELKSQNGLAKVTRDNGVITAGHFIFDEARASFQAIGKGRADLKAPRENAPPTDVTVTWSKSLSYDDKTELLSFLGDVEAKTVSASDTTSLSSEQLDMVFTKTGQASGEEADNPLGDRQLRSAVAIGDVRFEASSHAKGQADKPLTRLRVEGPRVEVDNVKTTVTVKGAGDLLVEDYRPVEGVAAGRDLNAISLSGRGATLFKWTRSLTLDGGKSDMIMLGGVRMVHAPEADPKQRLQMACEKLEADMVNAGGISSFGDQGDQDADPEFNSLFATGGVTLRAGTRRVTTEFLRYTGSNDTVELWSNPPRMSQVSDDQQASALTAERIKWDLSKDRFEAIRMGSGGIPAGR